MNATTKLLTMALAVLAATGSARAATISFGAPIGDTYTASWAGPSQLIPDNNGSGVAFDLDFNDATVNEITGLTVSITISGGYNGDFYSYLSHGDGLVVLLNRIGRSDSNPDGSATSGFSTFTLGTAFGTDVHGATGTSGSPLTGNYAPDGRNIPPSSSGLAFDGASRDATFSTLLGDDPNGHWTLLFADVAPTFEGSVSSWGVSVAAAAVPEPATWVLLVGFGAVFGAMQLVRLYRRHLAAAG